MRSLRRDRHAPRDRAARNSLVHMSTMSGLRRTTVEVAALAMAVVLAACGSSEPDDASADDPSAAPADATEVAVSAFEFGYELTAPTEAGTYTFVLTNDGSMQHDLVLEGGADGATAIIGAGETDSFTATLEPGDYTLYCSVGSHRSQGMEVTFTVS